MCLNIWFKASIGILYSCRAKHRYSAYALKQSLFDTGTEQRGNALWGAVVWGTPAWEWWLMSHNILRKERLWIKTSIRLIKHHRRSDQPDLRCRCFSITCPTLNLNSRFRSVQVEDVHEYITQRWVCEHTVRSVFLQRPAVCYLNKGTQLSINYPSSARAN